MLEIELKDEENVNWIRTVHNTKIDDEETEE